MASLRDVFENTVLQSRGCRLFNQRKVSMDLRERLRANNNAH